MKKLKTFNFLVFFLILTATTAFVHSGIVPIDPPICQESENLNNGCMDMVDNDGDGRTDEQDLINCPMLINIANPSCSFTADAIPDVGGGFVVTLTLGITSQIASTISDEARCQTEISASNLSVTSTGMLIPQTGQYMEQNIFLGGLPLNFGQVSAVITCTDPLNNGFGQTTAICINISS